MKKILLTLCLLATTCPVLLAQLITYHHYLDYETEWSEQAYDSFCEISSLYHYRLYGDTLINGVAYYKVGRIGIEGNCSYQAIPTYPYGDWIGFSTPIPAATVSYIRETEDKKVYFWDTYNNEDRILYDFAPIYQVGELSDAGCMVVAADTVYFGAEARKRYLLYWVDPSYPPQWSQFQNYFVEGIGMIKNAYDTLSNGGGDAEGFLTGKLCGFAFDISNKMLCFRNVQGEYGNNCSDNAFFSWNWDADLSLVYHINDSYTVYLVLSNNPYMGPYQITGSYNGSFTPSGQNENQVTFFVGNYPCGTPFNLTITDGLGNSQTFGSTNVTCEAPLPVNLIRFTGTPTLQGNRLNWTTAAELNNDYFVIERSSNGYEFAKIGKVIGSANSQVQKEYTFIDAFSNANSTQYYRLKQVDFDGNWLHSNVIALGKKEKTDVLQITPNPIVNDAFLLTNYTFIPNSWLTIYDLSGKQLFRQTLQPNQTSVCIAQLSIGVYVCKVGGKSTKIVIVR